MLNLFVLLFRLESMPLGIIIKPVVCRRTDCARCESAPSRCSHVSPFLCARTDSCFSAAQRQWPRNQHNPTSDHHRIKRALDQARGPQSIKFNHCARVRSSGRQRDNCRALKFFSSCLFLRRRIRPSIFTERTYGSCVDCCLA
jgi:hypothetical protein